MNRSDKSKSIFGVLIICAVIIGSLFAYDFAQQKEDEYLNSNENEEFTEISTNIPVDENENILPPSDLLDSLREKNETSSHEIEIIDGYEIEEGGWIPSWGFNNGFDTVRKDGTDFGFISPVWFSLDSDGNIISSEPADKQGLHLFCAQNDIDLLPTIASFSPEQMKKIFSTEERYQKHLKSMVNIVLDGHYDGIDIDYEMIETSEKEQYLRFIKELGEALDQYDRKLSITVLSKWTDTNSYGSLRQTRDAQDWEYISEYADQVRIMTYDYNTAGSPQAGPIGPFDWQIAVLDYAVTKIPREKIWLGVHTYSYEWASNGTARALTKDFLNGILEDENTESEYNEIYKEDIATYPCGDNLSCTTYYLSKQGIDARRDLARKYSIAGLTYWSLGREGGLLSK